MGGLCLLWNAPYVVHATKNEVDHNSLGGCAIMLEVSWQLHMMGGLYKVLELAMVRSRHGQFYRRHKCKIFIW